MKGDYRIMEVKFTIPGKPTGKARPRFSRYRSIAYTPKSTVAYESLVVLEYQAQCKMMKFSDTDMLEMVISAYYKIPKSISKVYRKKIEDGGVFPIKKPDVDNIFKIIADSLNGIAYRDDAQIVVGVCKKYYSDTPRVDVEIRKI